MRDSNAPSPPPLRPADSIAGVPALRVPVEARVERGGHSPTPKSSGDDAEPPPVASFCAAAPASVAAPQAVPAK